MANSLLAYVLCAVALQDFVAAVRIKRRAKHAKRGTRLATRKTTMNSALERDVIPGSDGEEVQRAYTNANLAFQEMYHLLPEHSRLSPCEAGSEKIYPCVNGWRSSSSCIGPRVRFSYSGQRLSGCVATNASYHWCSASKQYRMLGYQRCIPCFENPSEDVWSSVAVQIRCVDVSLTVGDRHGRRLYTFENGARNLREEFPAASGSKWVAAVAILTTVRDGLLTLDSYAKDILTPWWTTDENDPKSKVQLKHLLQFTSGFKVEKFLSLSHDVRKQRCLNYGESLGGGGDFWTCIRLLYDTTKHEGTPGAAWQYNSIHLQLALAMAVRRTRQSPKEFLRERVFHNSEGELVMKDTYFVGDENPSVSLGMRTTGDDYDAFLRNYISYKYLPKWICDIMEAENILYDVGSPPSPMLPNHVPKMKPAINIGDQFGMALYKYPTLYGNCVGIGGTMGVCVNRDVGLYYLILPPVSEYLTRMILKKTRGVDKITFESARWWIERRLYEAYLAVTDNLRTSTKTLLGNLTDEREDFPESA